VRLLLIASLATALLILPIPAVRAQHDSGHHDDGHHDSHDDGHHDSNDYHPDASDVHSDTHQDYHVDAGSHVESSVTQQDQAINEPESVTGLSELSRPAAEVTNEITGAALPGVCGDSPELLAALALPVTAQLRLTCHWPAESETP
jgi:hypothetical protein